MSRPVPGIARLRLRPVRSRVRCAHDFLLAGFGWCRMPAHVVAPLLERGKLTTLEIEDDPTPRDGLVIHAAHRRDRMPGPAGRWLLETLRQQVDAA